MCCCLKNLERFKVHKIIYNYSDKLKRYKRVYFWLTQLLPSKTVNNGPSEIGEIPKEFISTSRFSNYAGIKLLLMNRNPKLKQVGIMRYITYLLRDSSTVYTSIKVSVTLSSNFSKEFWKDHFGNEDFFQNFLKYLFKLFNWTPLLTIDV